MVLVLPGLLVLVVRARVRALLGLVRLVYGRRGRSGGRRGRRGRRPAARGGDLGSGLPSQALELVASPSPVRLGAGGLGCAAGLALATRSPRHLPNLSSAILPLGCRRRLPKFLRCRIVALVHGVRCRFIHSSAKQRECLLRAQSPRDPPRIVLYSLIYSLSALDGGNVASFGSGVTEHRPCGRACLVVVDPPAPPSPSPTTRRRRRRRRRRRSTSRLTGARIQALCCIGRGRLGVARARVCASLSLSLNRVPAPSWMSRQPDCRRSSVVCCCVIRGESDALLRSAEVVRARARVSSASAEGAGGRAFTGGVAFLLSPMLPGVVDPSTSAAYQIPS